MTEAEERLQAAGFGPGSGLGGPGVATPASGASAEPGVHSPSPARYEEKCKDCDAFNGDTLWPACDVIEDRLEAKGGGQGCCHAAVVQETKRVQRDGGCPLNKF